MSDYSISVNLPNVPDDYPVFIPGLGEFPNNKTSDIDYNQLALYVHQYNLDPTKTLMGGVAGVEVKANEGAEALPQPVVDEGPHETQEETPPQQPAQGLSADNQIVPPQQSNPQVESFDGEEKPQ